jgi:hypothetical protein
MADPSLIEAVSLPPKEAIAFLRQKVNVPTEHWTDLWNEAHSRAFAVAGAASDALVADFREAVAKALENGTTLASFRKDFDAIVAKHGWEHTGTPGFRASIIYETNLSTAYSAGRYAQMTEPDVLEAFPFWRYQHNAAVHPRVQHVAWSGLVLRADDPWWGTHYPPNGWRCHCSVSPVSDHGLERMGRTGPDKAPPVDMRKWTNPRTGEVVDVPHGIDPGFGYNPGKAWLEHAPRPEVGQLPERPASAPRPPPRAPGPVHVPAATELAPGPDLGPVPVQTGTPDAVHPIPPPPATPDQVRRFLAMPVGNLPVGILGEDVAKAIGAKQRSVLLSGETAEKQLLRHPDLRAADYVAAAAVMANPDLALQETGNTVMLFKAVGGNLLAAVKTTGDGGENYLTALYRVRPADVRRFLRRGRILLGSAAKLLG